MSPLRTVSVADQSSFFHILQEDARSGMRCTAIAADGQFHQAAEALKKRIVVAAAGKKLLDGGVGPILEVAAKHASSVACDAENNVIASLHTAIGKLEVTESKFLKLRTADLSLAKYLIDCEDRCKAYKNVEKLLHEPVEVAELSPEEYDAFVFMTASETCSATLSTLFHGLDNLRHTAITTFAVEAGALDSSHSEADVPKIQPAWQQDASSNIMQLQTAFYKRIGEANAAKDLLNKQDESTALMLAVKSALHEAGAADTDVARAVEAAVIAFEDSAAKLRSVSMHHAGDMSEKIKRVRFASSNDSPGLVIAPGHLSELADQHEARASVYKEVARMLQEPLKTMELFQAEKDALAFLEWHDLCCSLHSQALEQLASGRALLVN